MSYFFAELTIEQDLCCGDTILIKGCRYKILETRRVDKPHRVLARLHGEPAFDYGIVYRARPKTGIV